MSHTSVGGTRVAVTVDRRLYDAAVCHGADLTGLEAGAERAERPVRLVATATMHTPSLLVALAVGGGSGPSARTLSAGLVRLAHHALGVHARDNAYDPGPWIEQAITVAGLQLHDEDHDGESWLAERLQDATEHLGEALVALASDRMGFADHITQAQGVWLSCFAETASARTGGLRFSRG